MKGDLGIWKSVDQYVDFAVKHQVFGSEASKLYKKMNKSLSETHQGSDYDFGISKVTKRKDQLKVSVKN